jgi:hypothetical protein
VKHRRGPSYLLDYYGFGEDTVYQLGFWNFGGPTTHDLTVLCAGRRLIAAGILKFERARDPVARENENTARKELPKDYAARYSAATNDFSVTRKRLKDSREKEFTGRIGMDLSIYVALRYNLKPEFSWGGLLEGELCPTEYTKFGAVLLAPCVNFSVPEKENVPG